jgi:predicted lipoprotein with Yx(FWY)xxD motif
MRHPKIIIAGLGVAIAAAAGGITAASAGGATASSTAPASAGAAGATVHTVPAAVAGHQESILVSAHGLPLYYYRPDTATKSLVAGGLAVSWPPLTAAAPTGTGTATATGTGGRLSVVSDTHGRQVAYNGHLLYTFTGDRPGQVTGQGVANFFVATPALAPVTGTAPQAGTAPVAPPGGYGY